MVELILGVEVSEALLQRWAGWLAPERQPFYGAASLLRETGAPVTTAMLDPAVQDTMEMYGDDERAPHVMLDEAAFLALDKAVRGRLVRAQVLTGRGAVPTVRSWGGQLRAQVRGQADGHRFVWWPSLLAGREARVLPRVVADDWRASRHTEVDAATWARAQERLPGARAIAGSFAPFERANCFHTVLSAITGDEPDGRWVLRDEWEALLSARTRPGGRDDEPGTILLWRSRDGLAQHAAICLGDGWALNKANQSWQTPRAVLTVDEVVMQSRATGQYLSRRRLS